MKKIHERFQRMTRGKAHPGIAFGTNFAGGMAILCYIGYRMDAHYGTEMAWTVTGAVLGLMFGAYELWKVIRWIQRRDEKNDGV